MNTNNTNNNIYSYFQARPQSIAKIRASACRQFPRTWCGESRPLSFEIVRHDMCCCLKKTDK